eukprot:TRINITY_DN49969_c0_g1_i1.p1 TRINITY_DN49969_c0_g1~~TRINITY_DN49969_c0_g1_i1.p1  ORF type:complete len:1283 (+),score=379.65 TRINITY_DN49969_c0_g1_i1:95-3850(+)
MSQTDCAHHVVEIIGDDGGREMELAAPRLQWGLQLRTLYRAGAQTAAYAEAELPLGWDLDADGLPQLADSRLRLPSFEEFRGHVEGLRRTLQDGHCRTAARGRLDLLERKFDLYRILNQDLEDHESQCGTVDLSGSCKVDLARLSTAVDAQTLVEYMRQQLDSEGGSGELGELVKRCGLTPASLSVDGLGLRPRASDTFHRFDIFSRRTQRVLPSANARPVAELLTTFLRHTNANGGRHFAELVRPILNGVKGMGDKTATVLEVPIKGAADSEWDVLAAWTRRERITFASSVRICASLPRLREIHDHFGQGLGSVADQLRRFFVPLWRATAARSGELHELLKHVDSLSMRTEEEAGVPELPGARPSELPAGLPLKSGAWQGRTPDAVFLYHFWVQLCRLNEFRRRQGLHVIALRLSCSELKNTDHLIAAYLLADSASHGSHLAQSPALTYLFYLSRFCLVQSPVADSARAGAPYQELPFPRLLRQGLCVSLATADPLHFHRTPRPLVEEYGAAVTGFKLSPADLCEVAANGLMGAPWAGNSEAQPVPAARRAFRQRTYTDELRILADSCRRLQNHSLAGISHRRLSDYKTHGHAQTEDYVGKLGRLDINGPPEEEGSALSVAADRIRELLELRRKYLGKAPAAPAAGRLAPADVLASAEERFAETGVFCSDGVSGQGPGLAEFVDDYATLCSVCVRAEVLSLAQRRLRMLDNKFGVHSSLHRLNEAGRDLFGRPVSIEDNRDFYRTTKVDTHVHMAAGMTASELLDFIRGKVEYQGDDVVHVRKEADGSRRVVTLREMMQKLGISDTSALTVDSLGVQADASVWERFDNFNAKYAPLGEATLRTLFLKTDTSTSTHDDILEGRYFAELCKKTFRRMNPSHFAENRLSIYGKSETEWERLSKWFSMHGMSSHKNKWIIQVPRLYATMKRQGQVRSFAHMLCNLFRPLWKASAEPERYPALDHFLRHISGFDSVDSEATFDLSLRAIPPQEWTGKDNPPYAYWLFFMWANIRSLNAFRASRGQSTLSFRPHCGEVGDFRHLAAAFLVADGISHGIELRQNPALQYLYYLARIPLALSPLSNNSLFLFLEQHPFPDFFRRGLYVSLSTDDPLFFHQTQEPLVEEYAVAGKLWRLSSTDLCEIARNSVTMSGFDDRQKAEWAGPLWALDSSAGNNSKLTSVPDLRVAYRFETYHDELVFLDRVRHTRGFTGTLRPVPRFMLTLEEEDELVPSLAEMRRRGSPPPAAPSPVPRARL